MPRRNRRAPQSDTIQEKCISLIDRLRVELGASNESRTDKQNQQGLPVMNRDIGTYIVDSGTMTGYSRDGIGLSSRK